VSLLDEVAARIVARFPDLDHVRSRDHFAIPPRRPDGFVIRCVEITSGVVVHFDGWHEEFADAEAAARCIAFGLSNRCRLAVHRKGAVEFIWSLEGRGDDGTWREDSRVGLLLFPFWRRTAVDIRTNGWPPNESPRE
jgi:hypothetical protein